MHHALIEHSLYGYTLIEQSLFLCLHTVFQWLNVAPLIVATLE